MAATVPALRDPDAIPSVATELAQLFTRAGRSLYLVGGSVRGLIQHKLSGDLDFATDAAPEEVLEIVKNWHEGTWTVGIEFGTVGLMKEGHRLEITTFRGDRYDPESRKPEVARVSTIEDDLARRDFTINAMAVRLPDREFVDPFGGKTDLERELLRTPMSPEDSLSDDPLRMLRAARFVAQLGVTPAPELVEAMRAQRERLKIVSSERIRDELLKIIEADHPAAGLDLAVETGLGDEFLPELPALRLEQDPIHRHKDVYRHSLAVMENLMDHRRANGGPDVDLRLAGLMHDIGKPATRRFGPDGVSFHHHEVVGARMAEHRLRDLHFPTETIRDITTLIELHLRFHEYRPDWRDMVVQVMREHDTPEDTVREIGRIVGRAELEYRSAPALMDDVAARLRKAGFDDLVDLVREAMTLRQKLFGAKPGWKDSAVRRYVRDAGPLLPRLNALVLADCTTRNQAKAKRLQLGMALFESRIARLAAEENIKQMRPALNGDEVMQHLGIPPSRDVGEALRYLLEVRLDQGEIGKDEAKKLLDAWAAARNLGNGNDEGARDEN